MGEGNILVKAMGFADVAAAFILAISDVPVIGPVKWVIVAILAVKGIPSLLA
jgi:hypothetical protein